jgi:hypothetical protein
MSTVRDGFREIGLTDGIPRKTVYRYIHLTVREKVKGRSTSKRSEDQTLVRLYRLAT